MRFNTTTFYNCYKQYIEIVQDTIKSSKTDNIISPGYDISVQLTQRSSRSQTRQTERTP